MRFLDEWVREGVWNDVVEVGRIAERLACIYVLYYLSGNGIDLDAV